MCVCVCSLNLSALCSGELDPFRRSQLARLVIEMLAPLGAAATAVAFARGPFVERHSKRWGKAVPNKVISLDGEDKKAKKSAKRRGGLAAAGSRRSSPRKLAPRGSGGGGGGTLAVPKDAEVLLVVGGALGAAELTAVRAACDERGPALAVVLLNARGSRHSSSATARTRSSSHPASASETHVTLVPALPRAPWRSPSCRMAADDGRPRTASFPASGSSSPTARRRRRGIRRRPSGGSARPRPSRVQITEGASEAGEDRDLRGEGLLPFT